MSLDSKIINRDIDRKVSTIKKGSIIRIDITEDLNVDGLDKIISKLKAKFSIVAIDDVVEQINTKK